MLNRSNRLNLNHCYKRLNKTFLTSLSCFSKQWWKKFTLFMQPAWKTNLLSFLYETNEKGKSSWTDKNIQSVCEEESLNKT